MKKSSILLGIAGTAGIVAVLYLLHINKKQYPNQPYGVWHANEICTPPDSIAETTMEITDSLIHIHSKWNDIGCGTGTAESSISYQWVTLQDVMKLDFGSGFWMTVKIMVHEFNLTWMPLETNLPMPLPPTQIFTYVGPLPVA